MELINKALFAKISDYFITIFFLLVGLAFTAYVMVNTKSLDEFIGGFENPLIFALYYLWIKALIIDIRRIQSKETVYNNLPGFVFWMYGLQFFVYWAISDLSSKAIMIGGKTSLLDFLYHSNQNIFWLLLDSASSILIYPYRYLLSHSKSITTFLIVDSLKFNVILVLYSIFQFFVI